MRARAPPVGSPARSERFRLLAAPLPLTSSRRSQIQADMATSQNDHNAAVAIKSNTPGWLEGAPLQAEQADVQASQAALDQAEQLQLQLQQQQVRRLRALTQGTR